MLLSVGFNIEDLTRVAFSYEIYETSLRVRFCLSYDPLKLDFITFKMDNNSRRKRIVGTDIVNDVTSKRESVITRVVIRFL